MHRAASLARVPNLAARALKAGAAASRQTLPMALLAASVAFATATSLHAADLTIAITGPASVVYDSLRDGCDTNDFPDINPRAIRAADGGIVLYALHFANRPLKGPDFDHLKIDCHEALASPLDPNPAHYADRNFIAALWTRDGRSVAALVHHEYHADDFKRCRAAGDLACWYNTILSYQSPDGGLDFARTTKPVVAAAPFRQDVEQGRHRGFFNPSNIVADHGRAYALISTTGWTGQPYGNCLFRTDDPEKPGSWRAFDGKAFGIRYDDPYTVAHPRPAPCMTIAPFTFPVGSIVRHRASGTWIALFQAAAGGAFPLNGFYYATSRDLLKWSDPKILLAGNTLYGDLCRAGPSIIGYPAMLDPGAPGRIFDETGDHPDLFLTTMAVDKCQTGERILVREQLTISWAAKS